uniref:Uncharacterized protein n=1 Tax=Globisporangium ultimum (strain ATCC 200006 / CBS 805.95 / DAOM BR144) TaxID=431595 RepID=K3WHK8_GLOUD
NSESRCRYNRQPDVQHGRSANLASELLTRDLPATVSAQELRKCGWSEKKMLII